jgi:arylsulfatase A-like enzyme
MRGGCVQKKLNIVYIHSHDTGRFIQPYGYAVDTPRLQRLAGESVLFRKAFNAAPSCSASRSALLTGMVPHNNGMLGLAHLGWKLNDYSQHIIHTLHAQGYVSALSGIQHVAAKPAAREEDIGYTEILPVTSKRAEDITDRALDYLDRDHDKPFFLDVGYFDTHRPFPPIDKRDDPRFVQVAPPLQDNPENREDMAAFKTTARVWDTSVGRVLDKLEEKGLAEHTLVICTTDHGLPMPHMKCKLTDHGLGVLLMIRGPGGFSGGKVIDGMVSHIDIFPTVCDLLGIKKPAWLQGKSVLPLVRGDVKEINEEIFAEITYHAAYEPKRAVRTTRYKYIRRFDEHYAKEVLPNCDDSAAKKQLVEEGWGNTEPAVEQLYDLLFDPQERVNLAGKADHAEVLEQMRGRLKAWMERTNDPLLKGAVPLSAHGRTWKQSAVMLHDSPQYNALGEAIVRAPY